MGGDPTGADPRGADPRRTLDRVRRDTETIGASSARRGAVAPADDENDPAVRWGKRVGRVLSIGLFVVLAISLGLQLGWWQLP